MKLRTPNLIWLGAGLAAAYWLAESLLHTYVFHDGSLNTTLLGEDDANELWMRLLIAISFVALGWISERSVRAERRLKDDAERLNRVLHFIDDVKQRLPHSGEVGAYPLLGDPLLHAPAAAGFVPGATATNASGGTDRIGDLAGGEDDIGKLARILQDLSRILDERFKELHALLQLTHEVNMGLLLDEVLDKAYGTLQSVLPYNRRRIF